MMRILFITVLNYCYEYKPKQKSFTDVPLEAIHYNDPKDELDHLDYCI